MENGPRLPSSTLFDTSSPPFFPRSPFTPSTYQSLHPWTTYPSIQHYFAPPYAGSDFTVDKLVLSQPTRMYHDTNLPLRVNMTRFADNSGQAFAAVGLLEQVSPPCPGIDVGLDDPTPYGFTAKSALKALKANEQHLVLTAEHFGFFESAGAGRPTAKRDELTIGFTPLCDRATYFAKCPPGTYRPAAIAVRGTITVKFSRGATFVGSGKLMIHESAGPRAKPSSASFEGGASAAGRRISVDWNFSGGSTDTAVLQTPGADTFWNPEVQSTRSDRKLDLIRGAFTLAGGGSMRCEIDSAPPANYRGAAPSISVIDFTELPRPFTGPGSLVGEIQWSDRSPATRFTMPVSSWFGSREAPDGVLISGPGPRMALPSSLAELARCKESGSSWIHLETSRDPTGKLVLSQVAFSWGPLCNRRVDCQIDGLPGR